MMEGTVKWFNDERGYGFIKSSDKDYFVHYKEILGIGFKTLKEGDIVRFLSETSPKGLIAKTVSRM